MGLRAGWALDLTTNDEDGRPLAFDQFEMRNKTMRKFIKLKFTLCMDNPMCVSFSMKLIISTIAKLFCGSRGKLTHGKKHGEFCAQLYDLQWPTGRYLLREHPIGSNF